MSELVKGLIPAHQECPFMNRCPEWKTGSCNHLGVQHTVPYSCGLARLIDTFKSADYDPD